MPDQGIEEIKDKQFNRFKALAPRTRLGRLVTPVTVDTWLLDFLTVISPVSKGASNTAD